MLFVVTNDALNKYCIFMKWKFDIWYLIWCFGEKDEDVYVLFVVLA